MSTRLLSVILLFVIKALFGQVPLGSGSYTITNGGGPVAAPQTSSSFNKKIITNDWWTSLLWNFWGTNGNLSNNMYPHPFAYHARTNGLGIGYPTNVNIYNGGAGTAFDNIYDYAYTEDMVSGLSGVTFSDAKADDYSDWDVVALWENGADKLRARMGHGFTYTYFTKEGSADAMVTASSSPIVWSDNGNIIGMTINGHHYALFGPTGSDWDQSGNQFTSDLNGNDYWSIAVLPDNSVNTLNDFTQYAFAFVSNTEVSYNYTGCNVITNFDLTFENKEGSASATFVALYRHQWLNSSDVNTGYTYVSPRGEMQVVEGDGFTTDMKPVSSLPLLPHADNYDDATLRSLVQYFASKSDAELESWNDCACPFYGNYTFGRYLVQAGQVALIADQIGEYPARDRLVNWMRGHLENFLTYSNDARYIYYHDQWDALVLYSEVIEHCSINCLNDHNLQYGYFVRAAAIVEQFNPGWADASNWGQMVELLIRDVANTNRSDSQFSFMRNYDVYAGHSWAPAYSDLTEGADQESSSESLNFASALIYYGEVTGRQDLIDKGTWIYTNEVIATEQYWFDVEDAVFPPSFQPSMLGIVRSSAGMYQLWWALRPEHVLAINALPWTGGAIYLGRYPNAAQQNYQWIEAQAGGNINYWAGYLWPYKALFDAPGAIQDYNNLAYNYNAEIESEANNYYWLHTFDSLGTIDKDICADVASYAVFDKNGEKSYAVFNPPGGGQKYVNFSDGLTFQVPDDTLILFKASDATTVVDCNGETNGTAYIDSCGICVGGSTGLQPCINAYFTSSVLTVNVGESLTFTDGSTGNITTYSWDFGSGASTATAGTIGPHTLSYNTQGVKTIMLTVTGPSGSDSYSIDINVTVPTCNALFADDFQLSQSTSFISSDPPGTFSYSQSGSELTIDSDGSHDEYDYTEVAINDGNTTGIIDMTSETKLYIKAKASQNMGLRVSLEDINGVQAQNATLQGDLNVREPGSFDLPVTTSWQTFEVDYAGKFTDDWSGGGALDVTQIASVILRPNPAYATWPIFGHNNAFNGTLDIDFIIIGDSTDCAGVNLPVELLAFDAKRSGNNVQLIWKTASEKNNAFYIVERSRDTKNWQQIKQVGGAGNSDHLQQYTITDHEPLMGISYYRLTQVDLDGVATVYAPVSVQMGYTPTIILYPNPAYERVIVSGLGSTTSIKIQVMDQLGFTFYCPLTISSHEVAMDLTDLPSGVYVLKISNRVNTVYKKLIVE